MSKRNFATSCLAWAALAASQFAGATEYFWIAGPGNVNDPSKWQDYADPNHHQVPAPADSVWFYGADPPYAVDFTGDFTTRYGYVTGTEGSLFFNLAGGAYHVNDFRVGEYDGDGNPAAADDVTAIAYGDPALPHLNMITNFVTVGGEGTGNFWLSNAAQLQITPDPTLTYGDLRLGYAATGVGTLNVVDPDTLLDANNQNVYVGYAGTGTLWVFDGAQLVDASTVFVGTLNGNSFNNTVNVRDPGSLLAAKYITVGDSGQGTLWATEQAQVDLSGTEGALYIGYGANGTGIVNIADPGTTFDANLQNAYVGYDGTGTLWAFNGGQVVDVFSLYAGTELGSNGSVNVRDLGSLLDAENLIIGSEGSGTMFVSNAGVVTSIGGTIGEGSAGVGFVSVDGADTRWTNTGDVRVAVDGIGTLQVTNSGTVEATNVHIGTRGELRGDGNVVADVNNSGLVLPGASAGFLFVLGDYTQTAAGELHIELASASDFDRLIASGQVRLDGGLEVALLDSFAPAVGNVFEIVQSGQDILGTFSSLSLPTLSSGLSWDVTYSSSAVRLQVVGANLMGDYNKNGTVDAADYVVWRNTLGQTGTGLAADGNGDNMITPADYSIWRAQFGKSAAAVGNIASTAVPEPSTWLLLAIACWMKVRSRNAFRKISPR